MVTNPRSELESSVLGAALACPAGRHDEVREPDGGGCPRDVEVQFFSWRVRCGGEYDVLHVHWPELLLGPRRGASGSRSGRPCGSCWPGSAAGTSRLVRTVHNVEPHELGLGRRAATARGDRPADRPVHPAQPDDAGRSRRQGGDDPARPLPRSFRRSPRALRQQGRLLYFGIIRPYKGVERLIEVFTSAPRPGIDLRIVGNPRPELREAIENAVVAHPDLTPDSPSSTTTSWSARSARPNWWCCRTRRCTTRAWRSSRSRSIGRCWFRAARPTPRWPRRSGRAGSSSTTASSTRPPSWWLSTPYVPERPARLPTWPDVTGPPSAASTATPTGASAPAVG